MAALLAALGLGPLFWSLGFIFAAALTQHLLSGELCSIRDSGDGSSLKFFSCRTLATCCTLVAFEKSILWPSEQPDCPRASLALGAATRCCCIILIELPRVLLWLSI